MEGMTESERKFLFSTRLRERVKRNMLPTVQIAEKAGLTSDRLYGLMNPSKQTEPKLCEITKLCETLKIDPLWLIGWRD